MTTDSVSIFVPGKPAPKGSMRAYSGRTKEGRSFTSVTHDNPKTRPWSAAISSTAYEAMRGREKFVDTPLVVEAIFALERPQSHYGKNGLRPSAPRWPAKKPDCDKLARLVGDSMEGIVYDQDSRIVGWWPVKIYADGGLPSGVAIRVRPAGCDEYERLSAIYAGVANE